MLLTVSRDSPSAVHVESAVETRAEMKRPVEARTVFALRALQETPVVVHVSMLRR